MLNISPIIISDTWEFTGVQAPKILSQSGERIVYELVTNEGKFVLKVADPSKTEENIRKDTFAFKFLKDHGFPYAPALVPTKHGANYITIANQFAYVLEYIEGEKAERTTDNWRAIGKIAAQLHKIKDYPYETAFTFESERRTFPDIARQLPFGDEWLKLAQNLSDLSGLPKALIHTDIGLNNVMQKADGALVVIDWDDVGVGTRILDLGFPLICHFVTEELVFEREKAIAFYDSYTAEQQLTEEEKRGLFDAGLLFALIYTPYGNTDKHWRRVQFALQHRELISSAFDR